MDKLLKVLLLLVHVVTIRWIYREERFRLVRHKRERCNIILGPIHNGMYELLKQQAYPMMLKHLSIIYFIELLVSV